MFPLACGLVACDLEPATPDGGDVDDGGGATNPDEDEVVEGAPFFAVSTLVMSGGFSQTAGFIEFAPGVDAASAVDKSLTIEMPSDGMIFGRSRRGDFFLTDSSNGSVVKYRLSGDSTIEEVGRISFGAFGTTSFKYNSTTAFIASKTRGYLLDGKQGKFYAFDPNEMLILEDKAKDVTADITATDTSKGWAIGGDHEPTRVGDKLYWSFGYFDAPSFTGPNESGLMIIDTATDEVSFKRNLACGGLANVMVQGTDLYLSQAVHYSAAAFVGGAGREAMEHSCIAKFDTVTGEFDEGFDLGLAALQDGRPLAAMFEMSGTNAQVRLLDLTAVPPQAALEEAGKNPGPVYSSATAWETYSVDLANPTALTKVEGVPLGASHVWASRQEGHTYVSTMHWGQLKQPEEAELSHIIDLTTPSVGMEIEGWVTSVVRVR